MASEQLDSTLVFARTAAGEEAMVQRTRVVQRNLRMVLILVDGNATVADLCEKTGNVQLTEGALVELEADGFIERRVETKSVWRLTGNRKPPTPPRPHSEFSTFGPSGVSTPASSALSGTPETQIIPFPPARPGRPSPASGAPTSAPPTPSTLTPSTLTPSTLAPAMSPTGVAGASPTPESLPTAASTDDRPALLTRLRTRFSPGRTAAAADLRPIRRSRRRPALTWPMATLVGLLLLGAALVLGVLLFPYASYLPAVEAALAQSSGRPARVGAMRVSVYPRPGLLLEQVQLGEEGAADQLSIGSLRLRPAIGTLLAPRMVFREAELIGITLSAAAFDSLARALATSAGESARAGVVQVTLSDAGIAFGEFAVADLSGQIQFAADHRLESASLRSAGKNLQVELKPVAGGGVTVNLEATGWRPAPKSPYFFDSLDLKGRISGSEFFIDRIDARIFDGVLRGASVLRVGGKSTATGDLSFERINTAALVAALGFNGRLSGEARGKLSFSTSADSPPDALARLQASGNFTIHRGHLGGLDLAEAVRRFSVVPLTLGGATRFEELSGTLTLTPSAVRLSRLALNAGLMQATGQIEISRDRQLRGRMDVMMARRRVDHTAMPVLISGALESPLTQTAH
ncbi:MAG: putative protein involved in outer membrane biogenesis [Candidatus Accumulibacter sp. SK-11]|nr:MAG: putative protein involved in outer membrane biogenesis [Candidatus Accumulibacter sp. SK-11]